MRARWNLTQQFDWQALWRPVIITESSEQMKLHPVKYTSNQILLLQMLLLQLMQSDKTEIFQREARTEVRSQALPIFCRYWNKVSILSEICVCLFVYNLLVAARSFRAVSCYCHKYQHWSKKWTVKSDFISSSEAIYLRKKLAYRAKLFLLKPKKESMHYPCW